MTRLHVAALVVSLLQLAPAAQAGFVSKGFLDLPASAEIGAMSAVRVDRPRNLIYVLHRGTTPLLRFDGKGKYLGGWGVGLFKVPHGLRIDPEGNVWITDNGFHTVQKFTPEGKLLLTLKEANGPLKSPDDIVFAPNGNIYIADTGNSRILRLSGDLKFISQFGKKGKGDGEFATAHSMEVDRTGRIYIGDRNNNRVQVFSPEGTFIATWTGMGNPFGVLLFKDRLLTAEGEIHKIYLLNLKGEVQQSFGGKEMLQLPHFMDYSNDGTLYVAEVDGKRVQMFRETGE